MKPLLAIADCDGTLIEGGRLDFSSQLVESVGRFRSRDNLFTIASGRPYEFLKSVHDALIPSSSKLACEGLIYESGSYHLFSEGTFTTVGGLSEDQLKQLDAYLAKENMLGLVPLPNTKFQTRRSFVTPSFVLSGNTDQELLNHVYKTLGPKIQTAFPFLHVSKTADGFDMEARDVTKETALTPYLQKIGMKPADCLAIGDSSNDFPMFDLIGKNGGIVAYVGVNQSQEDLVRRSYTHTLIPEQRGPKGTCEVIAQILNSL